MRSASPSELGGVSAALGGAAAELERAVATVSGEADAIALADQTDRIRAIVSAATRLYALHAERFGPCPPLDDAVGTTPAIELATALLKARDLNPFDLALWFSR